MERGSAKQVQATTDRTRMALEKQNNIRIKAAQPKHVSETSRNLSFVRYTSNGEEGKQRIIKMVECVKDPLEPPCFNHQKIPRGPPSPPAPKHGCSHWDVHCASNARGRLERRVHLITRATPRRS
ncbi:hypothetical protein PTTG_28123 [Puccinia triticina 1-1 BBBD Race 1]|uniref:Pre-mRNA-processing protein 45 n=1 Tax=Puccinia triticina (isolate 1-1 / race 1 (BBBD)) TaxID=630390 RepID=A0A180GEY0_PUCT1|nr:hypothetical protein PTTG_28123 [Puccinia triticina 1-1 BBBD Race 1]